MKLIFEKSCKGRSGVALPACDVPVTTDIPDNLKRNSAAVLPEVSELDTVRHFTNLSSRNFSVDCNFYPLGSCTMKYNPKILEDTASLEGFTLLHPSLSLIPDTEELSRGALSIIYELQETLKEITGMDAVSLQPMAGAQGELAGMMIIKAYHNVTGSNKKFVIVPDTSHGTNPSSVIMAGYDVVSIPTDKKGYMDINIFKEKINSQTAAVILTCPNTLGILNTEIQEISRITHSEGALMYCDGANMNAILGKIKPGKIGFDIMHLNLHKTFGTPHGGGGPGAGPLCVKETFRKFLPLPYIEKDGRDKYRTVQVSDFSIGKVAPFFGNFAVLVKAFTYIMLLGKNGLDNASNMAVLNANYILERLKNHFELPFQRRHMHECVLSATRQAKKGVRAIDIAKYLIDRGIHPPTIYFPLIVKEAMMIEPTETESKETLDNFVDNMIQAAELAESDPEKLLNAPISTKTGRFNEVRAAREPDVAFNHDNE